MSGTGDVTFGGSGYFPGMVTISASSLFGSLGSSSVNDLIKTFLTNVTDGVTTSGINFANWDLPASAVLAGESVTGSTTNRVDQYADMTTGGGTTSGSAAPATVGSSSQDVLMQFSGNVTLAGNSGTQTLVIGDSTNADYTVTDAAAGTMFLAGGANSVTLYNTSGSTNESIYSAGNDTINLHGSGSAVVSIYGNGTVIDQDVNASVVAAGSASVGLHWENVNSGGTLHFVNNSSVAATIYIGNQGSQFASTRVTADGGAGGGFFVGGSSGQNSLVGGSGVVTLLGAGAGDFLEAQSSIGTNVLGQGVGLETLVATSTTGSNLFNAGINYPGLGSPQVSGVISTDGSGTQNFFLGNLSGGETIYGSTQTGASNAYFVIGDATAGGGQISLYNFVDSRSTIYLTNAAGNGGSDAHITAMGWNGFASGWDVSLSDGTNIVMKGLTLQEMGAVHTLAGSNGIVAIQG